MHKRKNEKVKTVERATPAQLLEILGDAVRYTLLANGYSYEYSEHWDNQV